MSTGWQGPARSPRCAHLGAMMTSVFGLIGREPGDVWVCSCGKRFVVRRFRSEGGWSKRLEEE